jgi:hypothetical protein
MLCSVVTDADETVGVRDDCDEYCLPGLINGTLEACDDCMLKIEAKMLDSIYGDWRIDDQTFSSILSSCSVNPTDYPHSTVTREPPPP